MVTFKYKILSVRVLSVIAIISLFVGLKATVVVAQTPPEISIEFNTTDVSPGSIVEVKVLVSSGNEALNAFDIDFEYSTELFSFEKAQTNNSVASLWKSLPLVGRDGNISLIGGSIYPWFGDEKEIITLIFRARREGSPSFSISKAHFTLADGFGTKLEAQSVSREVRIFQGGSITDTEFFHNSPIISEAYIEKDPLTKNSIVVLDTPDVGNIKWLGIRSRSWFFWSGWEGSELTASVPRYAWGVQLKALGFGGEEAVKTIYRPEIIAAKLSFLILILIMLLLIWRRLTKTPFN